MQEISKEKQLGNILQVTKYIFDNNIVTEEDMEIMLRSRKRPRYEVDYRDIYMFKDISTKYEDLKFKVLTTKGRKIVAVEVFYNFINVAYNKIHGLPVNTRIDQLEEITSEPTILANSFSEAQVGQ